MEILFLAPLALFALFYLYRLAKSPNQKVKTTRMDPATGSEIIEVREIITKSPGQKAAADVLHVFGKLLGCLLILILVIAALMILALFLQSS